MSDVLFVTAALFVATAPFGGLRLWSRAVGGSSLDRQASVAIAAAGLSFALLGISVALGDDLLDALDISPASFRVAAGLIMLPRAASLLWRGETTDPRLQRAQRRWFAPIFPFAVPVLTDPTGVAAVIAYAGREGTGETLVASALALAIAAVLFVATAALTRSIGWFGIGLAGRASGALLVVFAVELIADGIESV